MTNVDSSLDYFENLSHNGRRIYPDACDYGVVITESEKIEAREHLKTLRSQYRSTITKWGVPEAAHGSSTRVFVSEDLILVVDFNHDNKGLEFLTVTLELP